MLSKKELFDMYKVFCVCTDIPAPFEDTEDHFLSNLRAMMEENPLAAHRYFHYTGFLAGVETMFAKIGGSVENSKNSERIVCFYADLT